MVTISFTNGVYHRDLGLILRENEATSLRNIFKYLPGLWDTVLRPKMAAKDKNPKILDLSKKMKVLRMRFSIVENTPTPRESIFTLSRGSQLPYNKKSKNIIFYIYILLYN